VQLLTKSVGKKKATKKITLRVKSSEKITGLDAQLRKGSSVVAKGKLGQLLGKKNLVLKVTKKLRKGGYVLDLAGKDSSGARLIASYALKVK